MGKKRTNWQVRFLRLDEDDNQQDAGRVILDEHDKIHFHGLGVNLKEDLKVGVTNPKSGSLMTLADGKRFLEVLQWAYNGAYLKATPVEEIEVE